MSKLFLVMLHPLNNMEFEFINDGCILEAHVNILQNKTMLN